MQVPAELLELFTEFALTEDSYRQGRLTTQILDLFVNVLNERTREMVEELGLVFQPSFSFLYNEAYRRYMRTLLLNFRTRIQTFLATHKPNWEELMYHIGWQVERLAGDEEKNMGQTAEVNTLVFYQSVRPHEIVEAMWNARMGDARTCATCRWLHGTVQPIGMPFLISGQEIVGGDGESDTFDYIDRPIATAHPRCRCWLTFRIRTRT